MRRVGKHTFGSRALQCVLAECASDKAKMANANVNGDRQSNMASLPSCRSLELMADAVLNVVSALAQSAAGNFVLQSILQNGTSEHRVRLVREATQDLVCFACNKHASHFVERCVAMASDEELSQMVSKLLQGSHATPPVSMPALVGMMNNSFANFVVTTLIGRVASSRCNGANELRNIMATFESNMRGTKIGE